MQISLKDWMVMEGAVKRIKEALDAEWRTVFALLPAGNNTPEAQMIMKLVGQIDLVREQAGFLMDCHSQSEWTGGNSDDPKNHKLREPNCCPLPHRKFTAEEVAEANMVCDGPCQWRKGPDGIDWPDGMTPKDYLVHYRHLGQHSVWPIAAKDRAEAGE